MCIRDRNPPTSSPCRRHRAFPPRLRADADLYQHRSGRRATAVTAGAKGIAPEWMYPSQRRTHHVPPAHSTKGFAKQKRIYRHTFACDVRAKKPYPYHCFIKPFCPSIDPIACVPPALLLASGIRIALREEAALPWIGPPHPRCGAGVAYLSPTYPRGGDNHGL